MDIINGICRQQISSQFIPSSKALLDKLTASRLFKKFPAFHEIWSSLLVHRSLQLVPSLNQMSRVYTVTTYPLKTQFNIIPHLRLGISNYISSSGFLTRIVYAFITSPCALTADRSGRGMKWLCRSSTGRVSSNPTRAVDVCLHLFCARVVLCR
jgi:hypothetical protein